MIEISGLDLIKIIRARQKYLHVPYMDPVYFLPSNAFICEQLLKSQVDKDSYRFNTWDCDDFGYMLYADLKVMQRKYKFKHPLAFGIVKIQRPKDVHVMNFFVNDKKELVIVEPQNDIIMSIPDNYKIQSIWI